MSLVQNRPHQEITFQIINAAMAVHNQIGPGHKEVVYRARTRTRVRPSYPFPSVSRMSANCASAMPDVHPVYTYRVHFLVENRVLV